jgi:quinol monooxygenase YgiN
MPDRADKLLASKSSRKLRIIDIVRPHWKTLAFALVAVLGETLAGILEPWPIKVVVEFQARPGARAELMSLLAEISATYGPKAPGFLGSAQYVMLDSPDGLVEIAEWESAEAQAAAVEQATAAGVYTPVMELVAAPFRATRIGQLS